MGGTNGVAICCYDSWNGVCFCLMYAGGLLGRLNVVACGAGVFNSSMFCGG